MAYSFKHGDRPLDGYTIQRGIGRGGFGEVYYAISDGGREVALKYLRDNAEIELRGVSACMNLKSPHLVTIFDVRRNGDGDYFIVMEHVAGPSLSDVLVAETGGIGVEKATYFLCEIGRGLSYLHDRGIVHRDMKPANIFYEDGQVKIGDYGLSKFISVSRHSAQTTSVGTVHYMAPEVGSGHYTRGIDIYALGVMLYEMLLGRVPFEGSSLGEILMKHLTEQPEVDQLPEPFGKVIRKALAKDPKDRYQTVEEMVGEVLAVGDIKSSLAGFDPVTITNVPRVPTPAGMHSPIPSPNPTVVLGAKPPLPPLPNVAMGSREDLPPAIAKRVSRISDKVERKMDKLAGRKPRRRYAAGVLGAGGKTLTFQAVVFSLLITFVTSVGLGVLVVMWSRVDQLGVTTGMMVPLMAAGVLLSAKSKRLLGDRQPSWVNRIVTIAICLPFMGLATAPLASLYESDAFALTLGLLAIVIFADWEGRITSGSEGDLSWGAAFWLGIMGGVCCAISATAVFEVSHNEDWYFKAGAIIAASTSLLVQALAWFVPLPVGAGGSGSKQQNPGSEEKPSRDVPKQEVEPPVRERSNRRENHRTDSMRGVPMGIPVDADTQAEGWASLAPMPRKRSTLMRAVFSLLCFMLLLGTVMATGYTALGNDAQRRHLLLETVCGNIAVFSALVFFAQKLTVWKRVGFWRETLCPLLLSMSMAGLGCAIAHVVIMPSGGGGIAAMVVSAVPFLLLLTLRFKRPRGRVDSSRLVDPTEARAAFVGNPTSDG